MTPIMILVKSITRMNAIAKFILEPFSYVVKHHNVTSSHKKNKNPSK